MGTSKPIFNRRSYKKDRRRPVELVILFLMIFIQFQPAWATWGGAEHQIEYLKSLSLGDLLQVKVTTVSKKPEKMGDAAAAVFVITSEDIRRSGVTSIPEALRMAPGIQVARINTSSWMVTSRGFSGVFANKLLVMIDGRIVYSPLFSGVFWDAQDLLLEDVERIEVIRGPGATLWGANAVNGIINIITKPAHETQGGMITAGAGTEEKVFGGARTGGHISDNAHFRIYAKYFERDEGEDVLGVSANDNWDSLRGGFRLDWTPSDSNTLTVQGDIYENDEGITVSNSSLFPPYTENIADRVDSEGGNILSRWEHRFSNTSEIAIQVTYDHTLIDHPILKETRDTVDFDFQHRFNLTEKNELTWGLAYRNTSDEITNKLLSVFPDSVRMERFSAFFQNRITLINDRAWFTLGAKFEKNEFTDLEFQPSGRLLVKPNDKHTIWAAVSRAVRTMSRGERGFHYNTSVQPPGSPRNSAQVPLVLQVRGNEDLEPEDVIAYELGYRIRARKNIYLDVTGYYNDYDNILSDDALPPEMAMRPVPHMVLPFNADNEDEVETYGFEIAADWQPLEWWKLKGAYTWFKAKRKIDNKGLVGSSPRNQVSLRSSADLSKQVEGDLWFRYVDELPELDVDDYVTLDARLAWLPKPQWELSIVGQNLIESSHLEIDPFSWPTVPTEVERSVYLKATWYF